MKRYFSSILTLLLLLSQTAFALDFDEDQCPYYLSACTIFQDEANYLLEWIEFHRLVGIEHFYLYNNNSHDDYLAVLQPYIDEGIVDLFDWPSPEKEDWTPYQEKAYNHCIKQSVGQTRWLAVIDTDEYLIPVQHDNVKDFLQDFDSIYSVGGITVSWQFYGTSWCKKIPKDKLMIETLLLKAKVKYHLNQEIKTICKPHKVHRYRVHNAVYKKGFYSVASNGYNGPGNPVQIDKIRLNHYWTRDEDFFFNVKIPRRMRCTGKSYPPHEVEKLFKALNALEDRIMLRFVPALRERVF
jgi:hypothetical protein